ncbi:hypothetical protein VNO78_06944 [Psophocarpus tetragonolobus]|uniref:Uncharacterized protein n=1 Tax=Psophocarpus tetragonolobus TaxID=3891 RepID=A0AAN9SU52_PSOTE
MVIEAVHIATLMFSGQPNPMTNMVAEGDFAIEDIYILYFGNRILHVINERFDCNYRLEAKGNNYILLSKSLQKMKEETTKTITKMIDELSLLTGPLATKDEFTAQKMHDWTVEIDGHFDKVKKKRKKIRRVEPQECR